MILEEFGLGWRNSFEEKIEILQKIFPEIHLNTAVRFCGMLRLDISAPTSDIQYIVDCVVYRIERDSAKKCENCGKYGLRRTGDTRLPEPKCLCNVCYALELDKILNVSIPNQE